MEKIQQTFVQNAVDVAKSLVHGRVEDFFSRGGQPPRLDPRDVADLAVEIVLGVQRAYNASKASAHQE